MREEGDEAEGLAGLAGLLPAKVRALIAQGALLLDIRWPPVFAAGHIPDSFNYPVRNLRGAQQVANLLPPGEPVILVAHDDAELAAAAQALRADGRRPLGGYLAGGIEAWDPADFPLATLSALPIAELRTRLEERNPHLVVVDVREAVEWDMGHIAGALHIPLGELVGRRGEVDAHKAVTLVCAAGIRSSLAATLLRHHGYQRVYNVPEGMNGWLKAGYPVVMPGHGSQATPQAGMGGG